MMGNMAYTILVADDEPAIRTMLEVILSADGHQVVGVPSGRAALEYLQTHTPDIMLLDINLGEVSGLDICVRVKKIKRLQHRPVLLLTGLDDQKTRDQARLVKADDLLVKPVSGKVLRARVEQLVQAQATRSQA